MALADHRLAKTRDFNLILKHGRWVNGPFLDLKVLELAKITNYFPPQEDPEKFKKQLRLAIAVGLKVSKKAVERNRLKRQLREVLRLLMKDDRLPTGYYLLVVAKKPALDKKYAELSQELLLLLNKSKLLA